MNNAYVREAYPLSPLQEGMLFHSLANIGTGVDIEQIICTIHEQLDVDAFKRAWGQVVERHAVLRSKFEWKEISEPRQVVIPMVSFKRECFDWKHLSTHAQEERLESYIQKDRAQGFEIGQVPLMRLAIFELASKEFKFIWTYHHILLDGRSLRLILEEVFAFYEAFSKNQDIELDAPRPFSDYVLWMEERDLAKDEKFWRENLAGFTSPTSLVTGVFSASCERSMGSEGFAEIRIPEALTSMLRHLASSHGLSLNTFIEGTWALLMSRYNDEGDILYGTTRSCRRASVEGAESMIGLLINTVPVRVKVQMQMKMIDWLKQLREQNTQMREYVHAPLHEIQRWSEITHGSPLFESLVVFENYFLNTYMQSKGGKWTNREFQFSERTNYPLTLLGFNDDEMILKIEFDEARFTHDTVKRMLGHIQTILESLPDNLDKCVSEIPILTAPERYQLLSEWNTTQIDYPRNKCIHELFEEQVKRTPDTVALVFGNQRLTYMELNQRANQLAHYLSTLGVEPDVLVGIFMERSIEMVVGLLGILKAGGAYVPLDPMYPKERIAFIFEETRVNAVLTQKNMTAFLPNYEGHAVCVDDSNLRAEIQKLPSHNHRTTEHQPHSSNLAYVIFTSGSTGRPKGVAIEHHSTVSFIHWAREVFTPEELDGVLASTSICFDLSVFEFFVTLSWGGKVILVENVIQLPSVAASNEVTLINTVPSAIAELLRLNAVPPSVQVLNLAGEPLPQSVVNQLYQLPTIQKVYDLYGPSETTTYSSFTLRQRDGIETIGRPIANTQIYLLDAHRQLVPIGVPGELYIGGEGLARGYLHRPEATAERFIPDPFSSTSSARLYKTSDLARYLPDGNIEFLGRLDHQVKIRGFRIELGEIEAVLKEHESADQAMVLAREDVPGNKRLVAYIILKQEQENTINVLRDYLKKRLPEYMVPSSFVMLEKFPLLPNGKVNRNALPAPENTRPELEETYVAPRTPIEQALTAIWADVLGVERVGINDNFFELGGHSLLAVRLFMRIRKWTGIDLPLATLFKTPTVRALAELLDTSCATASVSGGTIHGATAPVQQWRSLVPIQPKGNRRPVFLMHAGGGNVLNYLSLLPHLGPDQPVYGLQARGLDGVLSPHSSMEEMASHYIAEIRSVQSSGPYFLGGASFGGTSAFEIAHQLTQQGEKVALLALFDTIGPGEHGYRHWRTSLTRRLSKQGERDIQTPLAFYIWHRIRRYLSNRMRNLQIGFFRLMKRPIPLALRERHLMVNHNKAIDSYIPRPYQDSITLFRAPAGNDWPYNDPKLGWGDIARGALKTIIIDAHHLDFMEPPELGIHFAEELRLAQDNAEFSGLTSNGFLQNELVGASKNSCG